MTDLTLMGIEKNWQDWQNQQTFFKRISENRIQISTSVEDAFSNSISFYLDDEIGNYTLTDNGEVELNLKENVNYNDDYQKFIKLVCDKRKDISFKKHQIKIKNLSIESLPAAIRDFTLLIRDITFTVVNNF